MEVVQPPVQAVKIEVDVSPVMAAAAQSVLNIRCELVARVLRSSALCIVVAVVPCVIESGVQHKSIEAFRGSLFE